MLPFILAILCIASTTAYTVLDESYLVVESDADELRWAETYSVKATRISLMSNIVEDFSAWRTNQSSRVDYNQGVVKVIANKPSDSDTLPSKFEIHPETTEEYLNKITCRMALEFLYYNITRLDQILPYVNYDDYVAVGNETVEEVEATKFEYHEEHLNVESRKTVWASYSDEYGWIPIKYEVKKYNQLLGALLVHDIWTYYDYTGDVDDEVFETDKYGCEGPNVVKHALDSEKVTKELLFMNPDDESHVDHVFSHFKIKFNRKYAHENEHALRKAIFEKNMKLISSVNRRNLGFKLGVNRFTDMTPEEKQKSLGIFPDAKGLERPNLGTVPFPYDQVQLKDELDKLPKEYDMRVLGLVSPVKDQSDCGSCWTFAAAAVMESGLARVNGGKVLSLSNQAIIDCAYGDIADGGGGGCNGGFDYIAYDFITKHGLPTDQEYGPYKMREDFCKIENMTKTYAIKGYTPVTKYSANAMKVAVVNHGALYIYVQVSEMFYMYSSGIFYETEETCAIFFWGRLKKYHTFARVVQLEGSSVQTVLCFGLKGNASAGITAHKVKIDVRVTCKAQFHTGDPERPNHAVALVGYGEKDGETFWIIKNSYGVQWGDDGYILISARDNVCGVASNPTYPVF